MSATSAQPSSASLKEHAAPIEVAASDLPLSCPMPGALVWNMHPKVYLPIEASGAATCPYCGASYLLKR